MREATLKGHLDNIIQDMQNELEFGDGIGVSWDDVNSLKEWRLRWLEATISRPGFCVGCFSCVTPCRGAEDE